MNKEKGQTMLLAVVLLSGAILSAVSLSGLLVLFQLKQTTGVKESTQAIFAADSGIECVLFNRYRCTAVTPVCPVITTVLRDCGDIVPFEDFSNGARFKTIDKGGGSFKSVGQSGRSARSFEITF